MTSEQLTESRSLDPSSQVAAYESLLNTAEHCLRVEKIARKNTRGTTVSWDDAAQTAHAKLVEAVRAGKFREGDEASFYRWAATVARYAVIDLVRKEHRQHLSLDQTIPGSDRPMMETLPDPFDAQDVLERADLVQRAIAAITTLDQAYPDRGYLALWRGHLHGKRQAQLAQELNLTQGAISKRWKELTQRVAELLEQPTSEAISQELAALQHADRSLRQRSPKHW